MNETINRSYYPFRKNSEEIIPLMDKLCGTGKIMLGKQEEPENIEREKDALRLFQLLYESDKFFAPILDAKLRNLSKNYSDAMSERNATLCHSIRYDKPQAGHNDSRDITSVSDKYIIAEDGINNKMQKNYEENIYPFIKLHKALLRNAETIFPENHLASYVYEAIATGEDIRIVFDKLIYTNNVVRKKDTWCMIKRGAVAKKNKTGYLVFPKFTDKEIETFMKCHKAYISDKIKKEYDAENGICEADHERIDGKHQKKNSYFNGLKMKVYGWQNYPYIQTLIESPYSKDFHKAVAIQMSIHYSEKR